MIEPMTLQHNDQSENLPRLKSVTMSSTRSAECLEGFRNLSGRLTAVSVAMTTIISIKLPRKNISRLLSLESKFV